MRAWVPASAALAPVVPVTAWLLAQHQQEPGYSAVRQTISVLSQPGATDRWIMTTGLFVLGALQLATAAGLTEAPIVARILLGIGGVATSMTAVFPQPSRAHIVAAGIAFAAFSLWPALSGLPDRRTGILATVVTVALLVWFGSQILGGGHLGLSERVLAAFESLWPLAVVTLISVTRPLPTRATAAPRTAGTVTGRSGTPCPPR
ncbi:DUF998 domain-containing protein [Nakamurella silvestris]|nr:DUF998 domain-containing protein [Nakamurella silvestris]